MSKRIKIILAAVLVPLALGGIAPAAHSAERKSVGTRVYEQVENVFETPAGRGVSRVLEIVVERG